jgi:hypothetical protein
LGWLAADSYPGTSTSGIISDFPGFMQGMPAKMKTLIAGGRPREIAAESAIKKCRNPKGGKHHETS